MKTLSRTLILLLALVSMACHQAPSNFEEQSDQNIAQAVVDDERPDQANSPANKRTSIKTKQLKLIKTGNINMEVKSYAEAREKLDGIIEKHEAYLSAEREENTNYNIGNNLIIRVVSEDFESLLDEISGLALVIDRKEVQTKDVTTEFVDITARLKTKRELEKRYMELLKRANTIEDILKIEDKARIIREEIESAEGRLKYLNDQVGYSTINIYVYQKTEFTTENLREPGFFSQVSLAISDGWQFLLSFIVIIFRFWPFWLGLAGLLYILRKRKSRVITGQSEKDFEEIVDPDNER